MSKIAQNFGKNLKKYRIMRNFTQEQLAEMANVSVTFMSMLESGRYNTTLYRVELFAKILKIDYIKLLEEYKET